METLYGRTNGLKPSERKQLLNLYRRRLPARQVVSSELARTLAQLSTELAKPISLLLDRSGHVLRVAVGDARELPMPPMAYVESRLSGYRVLHTHLQPGGLSRPDLSCLFLNRLDWLAVLEVQLGQPHDLHLALLSPPGALEEDWQILPPRPYHDYHNWDAQAAVRALEEELSRQARTRELQDGAGERAVLVGLDRGEGVQAELDLQELRELARTAGAVVAASQLVYRSVLEPRYVVGRGKLEELQGLAYHENAATLIFGVDLSPTQAREVEAVTGLKVLDRTQLILDIFAQNARTPEAQVQVELAQLRYLLPRLVGRGKDLSRLGGGIGTRGPGESQLEMDRRKLQDRIAYLSRKLEDQASRRRQGRRQRQQAGLPVVAVVGYTNAGKTTLMQALTRKGDSGQNKLFATIRTLSRRGFLERAGEVVFTDTVGFIRQMPPDLVEAFRSTMEELSDADLLLHVIDASAEGALERHQVVQDLLADLEIELPQLLVLSKADQAAPFELKFLQERLGGVPASALAAQGLEAVKLALEEQLLSQGFRAPSWASGGELA